MSSGRPGACIFCGGGNLTTEDVIPKWLGRLFKRQPTLRSLHLASGRQLSRIEGGMVFVVRRVVCRTCNTRWMSQLQDQSKQYLTPMMFDIRTGISAEGQALITAWITMTAILMEWAEHRGTSPFRFYTSAERQRFHDLHVVPGHTTVWLARREWVPPGGAIRWITSYLRISASPQIDGPINGYVFTIAMGSLVLQMVVERPDPVLRPVGYGPPAPFANAVICLPVPNDGYAVWPPAQSLSNDEIEAFGYRWHTTPEA